MARIKIDDVYHAWRLYQTLIAAKRPLTLAEVSIAYAVDQRVSTNSLYLSFEDLDLESPESSRVLLLNMCGLLVQEIVDRVYFLHQTVKPFLLRQGQGSPLTLHAKVGALRWRGSVSLEESILSINSICPFYLNLAEFDQEITDREWHSKLKKQHKHRGPQYLWQSRRRLGEQSEIKYADDPSSYESEDDREDLSNVAHTECPQDDLYEFLSYASEYWDVHVQNLDSL